MFKENDFISGIKNNNYNVTDENMALAIVLRVLENNKMFIMVLDHTELSFILDIFDVSNSERKFNLENHAVTESVPEIYKNQILSLTNQIRRIGWDFYEEHSFNNEFGKEYSGLLNNLFSDFNFFETKEIDVLYMLNKYYSPRYTFYQT